MRKLGTLILLAFTLSVVAAGCAKKGDTKDDAEVTEETNREIEPATSGGMQRGFAEEEPEAAPAEEAPEEPAASDEDAPAPE